MCNEVEIQSSSRIMLFTLLRSAIQYAGVPCFEMTAHAKGKNLCVRVVIIFILAKRHVRVILVGAFIFVGFLALQSFESFSRSSSALDIHQILLVHNKHHPPAPQH